MHLDNILFLDHPNPMLIYDTEDLSIIEVNRLFTEKYGYSESEAKEITLECLRPEEDIPILHQELKNAISKSHAVDTGTVRHQTKSGDILYVQVTSQQFDLEGRNARIAHIYDITDTIELKNKYKYTLKELVHHIDENPLAMVKFDRDLKVVDWSKRAEEELGYTADEINGKSPFDIALFPEDEQAVISDHIQKIIQNGTPKTQFETIALHKGGDQIDVKIHASALKDDDDKLRTLVAFIENITLEKRIEQLFQTTEHMAQIGGWEYNPHSNDLYWTDQVYRIHEVPLDVEVSVEDAFDFYLPEDKQRIVELFESVMNEHSDYDTEFRIKTGKGNIKWVRAMGRPVLRNGKLLKIVGILADIDEQKAKREELNRRAEEKEVLLAEIHHRVKNNLAIISGLLELKSMEMDSEELVDVLKQSQLRIQSMAMIHEALYEANDFSSLNFSRFLENLIRTIQNVQGGKNKQIETAIHCDETIKMDVNQAIPCGLIINEAVTNAYKHAFAPQEEGTIEVAIETSSEDEISVTINDNGVGFPDDFIKGKAKSLGARMIRQLTTQLDGDLTLQNRDGAFVEITFTKSEKSGSSSNHFDFN